MKFSERIKQNYTKSRKKNIIAIAVAGWFLLSFVYTFLMIFIATGGIVTFFTSVASFFGSLLFCGIFGGFIALCIFIIKRSLKKIKTGSLEEFMKTLTSYGDPRILINYADGLQDRGLGDVDLRFDDRYMAFAHKRMILIRPMDQIRSLWDYGVGTEMGIRRVCVFFQNGEAMYFGVDHTHHADEVLRDFYRRSGFGKRLRSEQIQHEYAPFEHTDLMYQGNKVESDGKHLVLVDRKKRQEFSFEELQSCYMYMVSDSESSDDYFVILFFRDGTKYEVKVRDDMDGFKLYLQLLNCAPHLEYQYPTH